MQVKSFGMSPLKRNMIHSLQPRLRSWKQHAAQAEKVITNVVASSPVFACTTHVTRGGRGFFINFQSKGSMPIFGV